MEFTILSRKSKTQQQQMHRSVQDPSQPSDTTSTPASYEDDEISRMLEDSNETMPDIDYHTTSPTLMHTYASAHPFSDKISQQQPQWPYSHSSSSMPTESTNMFMSNPLDLSTHLPAGSSTQSGTETLDPMHVDSNLDLAPTWPHDPTLAPDPQSMDFFSNDMLTGTLSSSSSAPLSSTSSYPYPTRPSSSFPSSGSLAPSRRPSKSGKSSLSTTRPYTATPSRRDQGLSITTDTTTPNTMVETSSNAEAIKEASKLSPSSSKLTLTIDDPNSETVADLMGILAKSKAKMKLEVS
ncbi:hypothetical protein IMSHALPRED_005479 [Imshaugia aleurites]|uniref:Uncharacterized protein n=1 Tax=Imshaugia aleurites TaxID=172621 RepID=A0A8H3IBB1_9LECA|nr:hypothetical protein IMSHALPRED_005479 [Imshaugia aleurites]